MSSRSGGEKVTAAVRDLLVAEHDAAPEGSQRRTFLAALLPRLTVGDVARPAAAGLMVTVRFASDATHNTYLLGSAADRGVLPVTVCAADSTLGVALTGAFPGDTVSYEMPSGGEMQVLLLAVTPLADHVAAHIDRVDPAREPLPSFDVSEAAGSS
jgi:transcription elongation GreA/GreB family factor